jgi:hypothetical protein
MDSRLLAWIGNADIQASLKKTEDLGPIAQALSDKSFDQVHLITDFTKDVRVGYQKWLESKTKSNLHLHGIIPRYAQKCKVWFLILFSN